MFGLYAILLLSLAFGISQCKDLGIEELNEVVHEQQEMLQELQGLVLHQQGIINKLTSGKLPNKVSLFVLLVLMNLNALPCDYHDHSVPLLAIISKYSVQMHVLYILKVSINKIAL